MKDGFTTDFTDLGSCMIIVKNVPSLVCKQCGEVSYNDKTARRLEQIIHSLTNQTSPEIAVVNYSEQAA